MNVSTSSRCPNAAQPHWLTIQCQVNEDGFFGTFLRFAVRKSCFALKIEGVDCSNVCTKSFCFPHDSDRSSTFVHTSWSLVPRCLDRPSLLERAIFHELLIKFDKSFLDHDRIQVWTLVVFRGPC